uniref:TPPC8 C-terminal Ig-like domain-containing protein n=1 Tax=Palpitomonas bilix TaxID=652834 RepID=A0A7S3G2F9_9EUKA|mmetsp:Transcript_13383/g.35120  ORF Transcript_13383/g.35120 Transcript_13383/m.35120 type:complete len:145 (+) Transcript_13383:21-455(+)
MYWPLCLCYAWYSHNFAVDALCEVPVTLTVRNSNKEKEVRVELNTDPRFARAFQRGSKSSSHNGDNVLMWLGPSKCVLTIPPRSDQIVNLTLCASCYGQHMLNGTIFLTPLYDDDDAQFDSDENDDNLLFFDTHEYLEVFQIDA